MPWYFTCVRVCVRPYAYVLCSTDVTRFACAYCRHIQCIYIIFNGSMFSRRGGFHTKSHGVTKTSGDTTYEEATRMTKSPVYAVTSLPGRALTSEYKDESRLLFFIIMHCI